MAGGKNLLKKLLTGGALAGSLYFSSINTPAQSYDSITKVELQKKQKEHYIPKYNTIVHQIISEVQKEDPFLSLQEIDKIIEDSKKIVKKNYSKNFCDTSKAVTLLETIDDSIIKKYPDLEKGYFCYKKSLVYLAIAEGNNPPLPLKAIVMPKYMVVEWNSDSTEECKFYWDPRGLPLSYSDYYSELLLSGLISSSPEKSRVDLGYLRPLTKNELLSEAYSQESLKYSRKKDNEKALEFIDKALELNPNSHESRMFKGTLLGVIGESCIKKEDSTNKEICNKYFNDAIENLKKSLEYNPSDWQKSIILMGMATCFKHLKKENESKKCFYDAVDATERCKQYESYLSSPRPLPLLPPPK